MAKTVEQGIAQSVFVRNDVGGYITSIDLYFAEKDNTAPVFLELRPMENGLPSSEFVLPMTSGHI